MARKWWLARLFPQAWSASSSLYDSRTFSLTGTRPQLGLELDDARLQRLILFARQPRHVFDRLELLARNHLEIAQDAFGLMAKQRIDLAPHTLRDPGGVIHQARHLVKETVGRLYHGLSPGKGVAYATTLTNTMAICRHGRKMRKK
jgi:hypothetical protein